MRRSCQGGRTASTSGCSRRAVRIGVLPFLQQALSFLEQNLPKVVNQQAKGTAVFGQHDLPSAAVGPARPFSTQTMI